MRKAVTLLCLAVFTLLLSPPPVHAQGLPAGWTATPCDASGNPVNTYLDANGFYLMDGTQSTTVTNTYPAPYLASFGTKPITTTSGPSVPPSFAALGIYDGGVNAYNSVGYDQYCYLVDPSFCSPDMGLINGGVTTKLTGQLCYYFKVSRQGMGPAGAMPDHINLLLKTMLTATAQVYYEAAPQQAGLSASATASDGSPFNETASASAGDGASSGDVPNVTGFHLVRASVDATTGIAEVYLNGTGTEAALDTVPYGPFTPMGGFATNGETSAQASASVDAAVRPDDRAVTVSADCDSPPTYTFYKKLTGGLDTNGDGLVAKMMHTPTPDGNMSGDIGIGYGHQQTQNKVPVVVSTTSQSVTYHGHIPGNWATNDSHYWWTSSLKTYSTDGDLWHGTLDGSSSDLPNEADIPPLKNTYNGPVVDDDSGIIIPNDAGANGTTDTVMFKFHNGDNRNMRNGTSTGGFPTGNDGDGAIAAAIYSLTIHQPVEIFPSHKPNETHYRTATPNPRPGSDDIQLNPVQPGYAIYGGGIACTWNDPNVVFAIASGATNELGDVSFKSYPWISAVAGLLNISLTALGPKADNGTANFDDTVWNNSTDFPSDHPKGSTAKSDYHMIPLLQIKYTWLYFLMDNYNGSGFVNEELDHAEDFQGTSQWLGHFYYYPRVPQLP